MYGFFLKKRFHKFLEAIEHAYILQVPTNTPVYVVCLMVISIVRQIDFSNS